MQRNFVIPSCKERDSEMGQVVVALAGDCAHEERQRSKDQLVETAVSG